MRASFNSFGVSAQRLTGAIESFKRRGLSLGLLTLSLAACAPAAQAYRLNPGQTPEQFRITCKKRFLNCEQQVKPLCGSEFQITERHSNKPEQPLVSESDLSSTGPRKGPVDWEGELVVVCGHELPPLRLVRTEGDQTVSEGTLVGGQPAAASTPLAPAPQAATVCVPGVTQACLGPGACSGAQACLESGAGFGACDCGPSPQRAEAPGTAATAQ
jgi:hypothetical protein